MLFRILLCVSLCRFAMAASATTDTKYDEKATYDMTHWGLPSPGEIPEIYRCLNHKNFKETVIQSRDTWVIVFTNGTLETSWRSLANFWKGAILFAEVKQHGSVMLMREIGLSAQIEAKIAVTINTQNIGVVFPHGGEKMKRKYKVCENTGMAIKHVLKGLPSEEVVLSSMKEREEFMYFAYLSATPQIPVFAIAESKDVGKLFLAYYRVLAYMFKDYFRFAIFRTDDDQDIFKDIFSDGEPITNLRVPTMTALIPNIKNQEISYDSFPFATEMMGSIDFMSCVYWLYIVNDQYRPDMPRPTHSSYEEEEAEMKAIAKMLKKRATMLNQCNEGELRKEEL
uniref:Uncharacterized protein LOC100177570 n=1 Tax=Phallusia mammillata TaxID=59560 RepID=A0A6F9DHF9_9ASCI|nr:uncharacterized protein LOC100177570 [Phallusia mammillata]